MKKFLFLSCMALSQLVSAQWQSDTGTFHLSDTFALRIVGGYHLDGYMLVKKNSKEWTQPALHPTNNGGKVKFQKKTTTTNRLLFIASGGLKLNDSTMFITGWDATFSYSGIILTTYNYGGTWSVYHNSDPNTVSNPHDLFFITESIGLLFYPNYPNKYSVTFNQGRSWKTKKFNGSNINLSRHMFKFEGIIERKGDLIRHLKGSYKQGRNTRQEVNIEHKPTMHQKTK